LELELQKGMRGAIIGQELGCKLKEMQVLPSQVQVLSLENSAV
jgi:hypothetical protein